MLCSKHQLSDVLHFCCDAFCFSILGMDPTFNLREFSVTLTVYRHLLLLNPHTRQSPLLLGPILINQQKQFHRYNYFFSTSNALKQELTLVKPIDTDCEKKLIDATICYFPQYNAPVTMHTTYNYAYNAISLFTFTNSDTP